MAEIFVWREDRWGGAVRGMANALGKFIYVMDACMDLDKDTLYSRYNPFRKYYGLTNNAERFRDILRMLLGECIQKVQRKKRQEGTLRCIRIRIRFSEFRRMRAMRR